MNQIKADKKTPGRPSGYRPEYGRQAFHLCLLGATDADLAGALGVSECSVNAWKQKFPDFRSAIQRGKDQADAKVALRLYQRATGYSHKAVKIYCDPKSGAKEVIEYVEHYPPDTTACIFWLKNRRPDLWRDKRQLEQSRTEGRPIETRAVDPNKLLAVARERKIFPDIFLDPPGKTVPIRQTPPRHD